MEANFLSTDTQWMSQRSKSPDTALFFDACLTGCDRAFAVYIGGLDTGNCYFKDFCKEVGTTLEFDVIVQYIPRSDDADVPPSHWSHVIGIIVGHSNMKGIHHGGEVVKDAKLAFIDISKPSSSSVIRISPPDVMFQVGSETGAKIHSVCWEREL